MTLGYTGQRVGTLFVGTRSDGYMARVSGQWADAYGGLLEPDAVNCTRIDIQCTAWYDRSPAEVLASVWEGYKAMAKKRGRQPTGKIISGVEGPQTVNLGARQSERFYRVYDKFTESKEEFYKGAVRYEEEAKGDFANQVALAVYSAPYRRRAIKDILAGDFQARGVQTPWKQEEEFVTVPRSTEDAEVFVKLRWLREGVAPTVRKLVQYVGPEKVIEALFGETAGYLDGDEVKRLIVQYLAENSQEPE